jgi:hypothetical protein
MRRFLSLLPILAALIGGFPWRAEAQDSFWNSPSQEGALADPASLIGLTLGEALAWFGPPQSVHPVRGLEEWQDDVVFVYRDRDVYIYRDRVWQLGLKEAYGIRAGDPRGAVFLMLGDTAEAHPGYVLADLPGRAWPLTIRVNLDSAGKVLGLFIYRSDF